MYKALITDLDGTAVNLSSDGSEIDQATVSAVTLAHEQGKKIACATGRSWGLTRNIVRKLGIISPCIVEGGTRIIDPISEQTIWEKDLKEGAPKKIFEVFKAESSNGIIVHSLDVEGYEMSKDETLPESLRFIYLLGISEPVAVNICNRINSEQYAIAHMTPSWKGEGLLDVHVTHPEATKEHVIAVWQEREGVTKSETIGMGDSGNDVPIFQASGYKVAVGNATDTLKSLADYIAPPAKEHALKHVIETILLA